MNILKNLSSIMLVLLLASGTAMAGEEYSEENVRHEISYLAKKLLDMSGRDSYTIESSAYKKPYLGICSEVGEQGITLTCVTPGSQAKKAGLKSGDVVIEVNDISTSGSDKGKNKKSYFGILNKMKTGEVIKMKVVRDGKELDIDATVGSLDHPAYVLKINK